MYEWFVKLFSRNETLVILLHRSNFRQYCWPGCINKLHLDACLQVHFCFKGSHEILITSIRWSKLQTKPKLAVPLVCFIHFASLHHEGISDQKMFCFVFLQYLEGRVANIMPIFTVNYNFYIAIKMYRKWLDWIAHTFCTAFTLFTKNKRKFTDKVTFWNWHYIEWPTVPNIWYVGL